jgi:hypothetical protein
VSLEELIQDAVKRGELNHLSIGPTATGFHASFRIASTCASSFGVDRDPVEALKTAIKGAKMIRAPRGPSHKPTDPHETAEDEMDFG